MKKIIGALIALYSAFAFSATTVPVQLLNPTGSSSGQAIVSTGASSAPAWGGIGVNGIAAIAANTMLANATGSSAAPTAFAMPSCTGAANALGYTSGTGIVCNSAINAAQLGGATFASPPAAGYGSTTPEPVAATTLTSTGGALNGSLGATTPAGIAATTLVMSNAITPSSTFGIIGTTAGNNANAGSVGEFVTASATAVSLTTATTANCTSISLTAGDWDVGGNVQTIGAATTVTNSVATGITTTSATLPASPISAFTNGLSFTNANFSLFAPQQRESLSATTTIFLTIVSNFTTSTETANCAMWARRRR